MGARPIIAGENFDSRQPEAVLAMRHEDWRMPFIGLFGVADVKREAAPELYCGGKDSPCF